MPSRADRNSVSKITLHRKLEEADLRGSKAAHKPRFDTQMEGTYSNFQNSLEICTSDN